MTNAQDVLIRPLARADRPAWDKLWEAYLAFYDASRPPEIYDIYFGRLLGDDPMDFSGLVADQDGTLVGLTHYLFHRHGWEEGNVCYLQDLYTLPEVRGQGVGRQLINGVYAAADAAGCPTVYWLTQDHNKAARTLYDQVGVLTNFIKYNRV